MLKLIFSTRFIHFVGEDETKNEKRKNIETKQLTEKQKLLSYFFTYSFLGWILETVFCVLTLVVFNKRGFLYGPVCPIYGFGAIILIESLKKIKTNTVGKFFISMIAFTIFEYVVSVVLESLFGLRWWDYTGEPFNFQGRISLAYSIAWGIIGTIFVEKIHPFVKKQLEKITTKIPHKIQICLLILFLAIIIIDFMMSITRYSIALY